MIKIPAILEKCVAKLKKQGKSESSAFAICTASLKKSGKLDESFIQSLEEVAEDSYEFRELLALAEENSIELWCSLTGRVSIPSSHFFDSKNRKYPFRNSDGTINGGGVVAAWKLAEKEKASDKTLSKIKPYYDRCLKSREEKKSSQDSARLVFQFEIPEDIELKDKPVTIECLKMGKFRHPWYDVLTFDIPFFENMIRNFNADIPQSEIAFDFNHFSSGGAAAWVQKLFVEDKSLMATVELTEKGRKAIKSKEYRYFSTEYTDDYIEYEISDMLDEKGNLVTKESKISHGPTLRGGGLTNRPFIKGMKPVSLSEDNKAIELEEVIDDPNGEKILNLKTKSKEEVTKAMEKTLEELKKEKEALEAKVKKLTEDADETAKEELSKMTKQLEELDASIVKLEEAEKKGKSDLTKKLEEKDLQLEEQGKTITTLSGDVKALTESVKGLMSERTVLQGKQYETDVKDTVRELKEAGAFPATLVVIDKFLSAETAKDISVTLSEGEGDKKKEIHKSLAEIIKDIILSIPEEHRFTESEESRSVTDPTGTGKELNEDDVQKYADEQSPKLSYEAALIELSKDGKIS